MEEWKDIPGYEGLYEASNQGQIRTNANKITSNARYSVRHWKQRVLKQKYAKRKGGKNLDARVCLWKDGKGHTYLVSRLIAMTWCDGYSDELTVNHIDGNPHNNNANNLEWVTLSENIRKGFEDGLFPQKSVVLVGTDGVERSFRSMASASRYLGRNKGYVWDLVNSRHKDTVDGYEVIISE